MFRYVLDPQRRSQAAITDVKNLILMRSDLHTSFDNDKKFVFVPKKPQPDQSNTVTHVLSYSDEYTPLYHNTLTHSIDLIPRPYLLVRFAWAIFPQLEPFLLGHIERNLLTSAKGLGTFTPEECNDFTVPRDKRSGTGSPKKKKRTADPSGLPDVPLLANKRIKLATTMAESSSNSPKLNSSSSSPPPSTSAELDAPLVTINEIPATEQCETPTASQTPPTYEFLQDWQYFDQLRERGLLSER
ncbi:MAG: hypothetical protein Q9228_003635 [Teloschistes exilis]